LVKDGQSLELTGTPALFEPFPEPAFNGVARDSEMIGYLGNAGTDAGELEYSVGINLFPRSGHFAAS